MKLERRPIFSSMSEHEAQEYLQEYIKEKFKPNSRFMIKVPEHSKDDAISEIYIDLWKTRDKYDPSIADYTTYAYNRGRHVIKTILTQVSKISRIREKFNASPNFRPSSPSGYEIAEIKDELSYALERMTEEEKDVTTMRFYENKTVNEIAETKSCSPQKIYQILSGLKRLSGD